MPDLSERVLKSIEIVSTYNQVLITLSSAIITAVLGISQLLNLGGLSSDLLKISLSFLAASIIAGLFGLQGLAIHTNMEKTSNPLSTKAVNIPALAQLVLFALGMGLMVYVIPL